MQNINYSLEERTDNISERLEVYAMYDNIEDIDKEVKTQ